MRDPLPIEDILERAWRYFNDFYEAHGHYPTHFLVSPEEYRQLAQAPASAVFQWAAPGEWRPGTIALFGMEVYTPQQWRWSGQAPAMVHAMLAPDLSTLAFAECITRRPMTPCAEVTCPCGEVIWDLRGVWPHLPPPPAGPRLDEFRLTDMDMRAMRTAAEARVCAALGIPSAMIGFHGGDPVAEAPCGAVDSEASSDAEWEAAVHALIAQVQERRHGR